MKSYITRLEEIVQRVATLDRLKVSGDGDLAPVIADARALLDEEPDLGRVEAGNRNAVIGTYLAGMPEIEASTEERRRTVRYLRIDGFSWQPMESRRDLDMLELGMTWGLMIAERRAKATP